METFTKHELLEAQRSIESTLCKCEKSLPRLTSLPSQHTLLTRRIAAFRISLALIADALALDASPDSDVPPTITEDSK